MERIVWQGRIVRFFRWIAEKFSHLFEPEEVEVTFDKEGQYTYTKSR